MLKETLYELILRFTSFYIKHMQHAVKTSNSKEPNDCFFQDDLAYVVWLVRKAPFIHECDARKVENENATYRVLEVVRRTVLCCRYYC